MENSKYEEMTKYYESLGYMPIGNEDAPYFIPRLFENTLTEPLFAANKRYKNENS